MTGRRDRDDRGVSSLELAVIAPSLILLIFFVIQAALYLYGRSVALQAAREGVSQLRLAQTKADYDLVRGPVGAQVAQFATSIGSGSLDDPASKFTYDDVDGTVTVVVTGKTTSLVPFLDLHVSQTASGQIERFQDAG